MTKARFHFLKINEVRFHLLYEQQTSKAIARPVWKTKRAIATFGFEAKYNSQIPYLG
ncbi:hypothetical protein LC607_29775 [Nostoc sp. CHAB 5824]|nr:hypothetical protein [Nostoc sp. CHAB 5824]